ncbi:MAG: hypothetical protein R2710_07150 [Acidimicrobiales bacterium]
MAAQFAATVAPMHDHFVLPSMERAHVVYEHGAMELDEICAEVLLEIERHRQERLPASPARDGTTIDLTADPVPNSAALGNASSTNPVGSEPSA